MYKFGDILEFNKDGHDYGIFYKGNVYKVVGVEGNILTIVCIRSRNNESNGFLTHVRWTNEDVPMADEKTIESVKEESDKYPYEIGSYVVGTNDKLVIANSDMVGVVLGYNNYTASLNVRVKLSRERRHVNKNICIKQKNVRPITEKEKIELINLKKCSYSVGDNVILYDVYGRVPLGIFEITYCVDGTFGNNPCYSLSPRFSLGGYIGVCPNISEKHISPFKGEIPMTTEFSKMIVNSVGIKKMKEAIGLIPQSPYSNIIKEYIDFFDSINLKLENI